MAAERVMVEMGGERKRCTLVGRPTFSVNNDCLVANVRHGGKTLVVYDVNGVWCTRSVVDHICRVVNVK